MRISPTIGRVVWFTPGTADDIARSVNQRLAAIITAVWSETCVNLAVFDANGNCHGRTSVVLAQGNDPRPSNYFCEWMPYQVGQAAKTEQVIKEAGMSRREAELEDLLISAHAIAERKGQDTAWERFANRLKAAGIGSITAKVFRVLPDDPPVSFAGTLAEDPRPVGVMEFRPVATPVQDSEIPNRGPRVTPADIESAVASEWYFTALDGAAATTQQPILVGAAPLALLTFCVLVLRNGFTVVGTSACASPENFDAEIGKRVARQDAVRQVWPLLGYALRDKLAAQ